MKIDLLDDDNVRETIAVTLLQIKDYLHAMLAIKDEALAQKLEDVHSAGMLWMGPPVLLDGSVEVPDDTE